MTEKKQVEASRKRLYDILRRAEQIISVLKSHNAEEISKDDWRSMMRISHHTVAAVVEARWLKEQEENRVKKNGRT